MSFVYAEGMLTLPLLVALLLGHSGPAQMNPAWMPTPKLTPSGECARVVTGQVAPREPFKPGNAQAINAQKTKWKPGQGQRCPIPLAALQEKKIVLVSPKNP